MKVLTLFIASPGGVEAERNVVEAAAGSLNTGLGQIHRVMVSARRYEQLVGEAGNPQSQINLHADDTDIFVGILHRRWGSPTGNGHDSGFHEEFSRALKRWTETKRPRIALFFKEVDAESVDDPGEQLAKVLEFQKKIERDHTAFYNRFSSTAELETLVTRLLAEEFARLHQASEPSAGEGATSDNAPTTAAPEPAAGEPLSTELAGVVGAFADVLAGLETETLLDLDRLELFALSVSRDSDDVPVHLANRMFSRRDDLDLIGAELRAWFRRYVQDHGSSTQPAERVIPFASVADREWIVKRLTTDGMEFLASDDQRLRLGTLRLLNALKIRPKAVWPTATQSRGDANLRAVWEAVADSTAKGEMVRYWITVHRRGDLGRARFLAGLNDAVGSVGKALVGLFSTPPDATPLLSVDRTLLVDPQVRGVFGERTPESTLPDEALVGLVSQGYLGQEIRSVAIRELISRDQLSAKTLRKFIESSDDTTWARMLGDVGTTSVGSQLVNDSADLLGDLGKGADEADSRRRTGELLAVIARHDEVAAAALNAAIDRAPQFDDDALAWRFVRNAGDPVDRSFAQSLVTGENEHFAAFLDGLRSAGWTPRTIKFVKERIEIDALEYLRGLDGAASDEVLAREARRLAGDEKSLSRRQARHLLAHIPQDSDIEGLLAESWWIGSADDVLPRLMRVATLKRLRQLTSSDHEATAVAALAELEARDRVISVTALKKLLRSPKPQIRMRAFAQLVDGADDEKITDILTEYVRGAGTHYYNITCEADRRLSGMPI